MRLTLDARVGVGWLTHPGGSADARRCRSRRSTSTSAARASTTWRGVSPVDRGLVFVHGGGAHAHWWNHLAAAFADDFRVLALDLSGHGDSDHRDSYDIEQWTEEVIAVADAAGIAGQPVVIGHSMGGFVTIATASLHADDLAV